MKKAMFANCENLGRLASRNEPVAGLLRSLENKPNQPSRIAELLEVLWRAKEEKAFLEAYHRARPYGSKMELRKADAKLAEIAGNQENWQDAESRRLLALIAAQQGWDVCLDALKAQWNQGNREPELVRALSMLSAYNGGFDTPLDFWRGWLPEGEFLELRSACQGDLSPTFKNNTHIFSCVTCSNSGLELHPNTNSLACPSCGRTFQIQGAVPLFLKRALDTYREIEPQYWESCEKLENQAMRLMTAPGMHGIWRHALLPAAGPQEMDNVSFLKAVYYTEVHWLRLLGFFIDNAPEGGGNILDLGCSKGTDLLALARLFPQHRYFGLDVVLPCLITGQRFKGIHSMQLVCADATDRLPFADESIDLALSCNAIEHCGGNMMKELLRILKPGARALIMGPSSESFVFKNPQLRMAWLSHLMENKDYEPHSLTQTNYWNAFNGFTLVSHESDGFFYRELLEDPVINKLPLQVAWKVYDVFCDVVGKALNDDSEARWFNYIQMFELEKPV